MASGLRPCLLVAWSTLAVSALLPASVVSQTYPDGMVAYWKFDEGQGSIAHDSVGEHHGDIFGATWTEGQVGGALRFEGTSQVVKVPPSADWNTGYELTVEAWFNLDHPTYWAQIVGRDGYSCSEYGWQDYRGWMLELYSDMGQLTFVVLDPDVYSPKQSVTSGQWHHAVGVYDGASVRLFLDGQPTGPGNPRSAPVAHSESYGVTIGNDHLCFPFPVHGVIDEVAIYSRALTTDEIQQHLQAGLAGHGYEVPYSCEGFEPPMHDGPVTARGSRALPLKARLLDGDGAAVTDADLAAPPVLEVTFQSESEPHPIDVSDDAYPAGWGTEGNQFEYDPADQTWQYNLKTKDYTGPGTYTLTMLSGDDSMYTIDPTCTAVFLRTE